LKEKKYEMLERRTREIIAEYDISLTIRQVYYRLVSSQDILNNKSQYVYFDKCITEAREKDFKLAEAFEDKTRKITSDLDPAYVESFSEAIRWKIENVKTDYPYFYHGYNRLQPKITVILLEKQALETIFQNAIGHCSILVTARGFNSFTQMNNLRKLVENDERELHLYTFTDYDDSGLLIEKNFIRQMNETFGIEFNSIKRIAITKEQIEKYDIPQNPTKKTTHSNGSELEYFVELDALDPKLLTSLVKDVCNRNFDSELYNAMRKAFQYRNRRLKKAYFRKLKKIDLSTI